MSSYSYRVYQDGDEEQIVPLLQTVFNGWPHLDIDSTPLEYWRWKYQNKPGEEKLVLVSTLNDRIVGAIHAVPISVKVKDQILPGILGGDMAIHPDHRGFGLSKVLNELIRDVRKRQGRYFSYFATRNPRMISHHSKTSNRFTHTITNMVRIRDVDEHLKAMPMDNSTIMKIGYSALKLQNEAMRLLEPRNPRHNLRITRAHEFDDRADRLYADASKGFDFMVVRNKDYLNWKYCSKEVGEYEIYQALDDEDDLLGYIIIRINRFNPSYPIGYIVDILTRPDHMSISDHLIKEGVRYFDDNNVNICLSASPVGNPYKRYLTRNGFLDSRIKFILFYRYDGGNNQRVVNDVDTASKVHFSFGDLDALPMKIDSYE